MKDKNTKNSNQDNNNDKIHVTKSVFQTAKEQAAALEAQQEEMRRKIAEREKKRREEYDKKILEEKKELLRMKQGNITESETIHEEPKEEYKLSFWGKIKNFFYHSKWWLGLAVIFAAFAVFLIHDYVTKERPDVIVLVITKNDDIGYTDNLKNYVEGFIEDYNENDEILASVFYIPYSNNKNQDYANSVEGKMAIELESSDAMIILGGDLLYNVVEPEESLVNLEELYPDNPYVDGYKFMLKDTSFAEKLGIDSKCVTDDLFLCIRKPIASYYADQEEMQEAYDKDFPVFEKIIADLSE